MTAHPLRNALEHGADTLGVPLAASQVDALLGYVDLVGKWNRVYNLTAVRDPQEMLTHHLLDSLAVVPSLSRHLVGQDAPRVLDVGSGAGLPGVVLAIALPQLRVTCVDAVGKKASFIQQAAVELGLRNVEGLQSRIEGLQRPPYEVVTSRAFSSLRSFVTLTAHLLAPGGVWLAMKGKRPDDEEADLPGSARVFHVEQLAVPGLDADRCLVWLQRRDVEA